MKKHNDATSPNHYSRFKIQPIEFVRANRLSYDQGNVIKYVCRHDAKNGKEDLLKAMNYLQGMIADLYPDPPKPKRRRKRRAKVVVRTVTKTVERAPTLEEIEAAFPTLNRREIEKAIMQAAFEEVQRSPGKHFQAFTPFDV